MRGIRMRFEEQPGSAARPARRFPPPSAAAWRSARKSPTPCSTPMTPLRDAWKVLNDRKRMSLKTSRASGVSADNAHGVRPTGRSGCRRAPGPPESLAGLATAPVQLADSLHVAEHRLQAEQAGIAQGAQFVEADGEDFHAAQRIGAAQGLLQLAGTAGQGAGANGGSAPLMVCRSRRCLDIALAELAFELGEEVLHVRNEAPQHLDDQLQCCRRNARRYRPAPRPVRPRPLPLLARPRRRSCRDDRAGKAPGAPCRSASPHGRSLAARQASRSASEALAVMADRQPGEAPVGADSPGRLETIDIRHLHVHQHASNGTLASSTC